VDLLVRDIHWSAPGSCRPADANIQQFAVIMR
jgi:hypothetical protein